MLLLGNGLCSLDEGPKPGKNIGKVRNVFHEPDAKNLVVDVSKLFA